MNFSMQQTPMSMAGPLEFPPAGNSRRVYSYAAGILCIIGAFLIPSCCIGVPQVMSAVGLTPGLRCLMLLEKLRPVFVSVAVVTLLYQVGALFISPALRTRGVKAMLVASVVANIINIGLLIFVEIRYQ